MPHPPEKSAHTSVEQALADLREGKMVVVVDDADRENEGDLVLAAEKATRQTINFMISEGRGLICLALSPEIQERLELRLQVDQNTSFLGTNFTESINLKSQGISGTTASARAATIRHAASLEAKPSDFERPGFVFPLRAVPGGVLKRRGQTEASVDLARLAGLAPAGVICEVMDSEGAMIRGDELTRYCLTHGLSLISVQDVVDYRVQNEILLRRVAETDIADVSGLADVSNQLVGPFKLIVYADDVDGKEHLCIIKANPKDTHKTNNTNYPSSEAQESSPGTLVRIHSECLTGDIFGSRRCDCGPQFQHALESICAEGSGVLVYLFQEGRGIGLGNKLRAYRLQDEGFDTVEANIELGFPPDNRDYRVGAQILRDLGLTTVRLLTNNPRKVSALEGLGIKVEKRVPLLSGCENENLNYLQTKRDKLGHLLPKQIEAKMKPSSKVKEKNSA